MKRLNIFFLLMLCLSSGMVIAQPSFHIGLTTAMNSTFVLDKGLHSDPRYDAQATYKWAPVGFSVGLDITKGFGLQLESIQAAQGQVYQMIDIYHSVVGEHKFDLQYLQFPLLMRFMGGGVKPARFNFQIGPQLSILQKGVESMQYAASTQQIPDGAEIPDGAVLNDDGTYSVPEMQSTVLMSKNAQDELQRFKDKELQLAFGFGMDFDMMKYFYLSTNVRANYSFTDMRNSDLLDLIRNDNLGSLLDNRANLLVGVQIGLHWVIGGNRSFRASRKEAKEDTPR